MSEEDEKMIETIKKEIDNKPNEVPFQRYVMLIKMLLLLIKKQEQRIEDFKATYKKIQEVNYRANKNLLELAETSISKYKAIEKTKELEQEMVFQETSMIIKKLLEEK